MTVIEVVNQQVSPVLLLTINQRLIGALVLDSVDHRVEALGGLSKAVYLGLDRVVGCLEIMDQRVAALSYCSPCLRGGLAIAIGVLKERE